MDLTLGVAIACAPQGCRVRLLDGGPAIETVYGAQVRDIIKIRPRQLVAIDRSASPLEVVYRWFIGDVVRVDGGRIGVVRRDASGAVLTAASGDGVVELAPVSALERDVRVGDEVFFTKEPAVLHDIAAGGLPAHPERLRRDLFPRIEEYYEGRAE
ncbi:MAG: hypothetical protein M3P30_03980 [Chloroflexota bacterium]|nr:hypothetical protein [Chloroflexota bacterium]